MLLSAWCDVITKQLCGCLCQCSSQRSSGWDVNTEQMCHCLCQCPGQWWSGGFVRCKFRLFFTAEFHSFYRLGYQARHGTGLDEICWSAGWVRASEVPPVNALIGRGTLATPKSNAPFNHRIPPLSLSPKEAIENSFHGGGAQVVLLMSQILMGRKETISNKAPFTEVKGSRSSWQ